ncbi:unnamed protein product [Moneuplotes crassus]|uniref:Uncharacterized protein n=1 Tax=Euplotes crassus TaxID=5936 RepID=A0AAD1XW41_EUPCR|nr:unnamed protein product [Moneuplotes crassus]
MKKRLSCLCVDLIEDKIKNRGIFIIASLLFYIYLTWTFILSRPPRDNTPVVIRSSLDFPNVAFVGRNIAEVLSPRVKVLDSSGRPVTGASVELNVVQVTMDTTDPNAPICDTDYRRNIKGSLEYIRFHEVCKIVLSGNIDKTDESGHALFDNLRIERGPEGFYTFEYTINLGEGKVVNSERFNSFIRSDIFSMESMNTIPSTDAQLNIPFSEQPIVRLLDSDGKPLKGRRVVAFSWIDPTFLESVVYQTNSPSHLKFLTLENVISEPSDENGIARFTSLTVSGSNEILSYIHFYSEGVTTPWTDRPIGNGFEDLFSPRAIFPFIPMLDDVFIEIENDHSREEIEGSILSAPYSLIVRDPETLEPVPNRLCFANMYKSRGDVIPAGYQSWYDRRPVKHIERPIPGEYTIGADNPEYAGEVLSNIYLTDREGKVSFDDLRISTRGPIGNFSLGFSCGGAFRAFSEHEIVVRSTIDEENVRFAQQVPDQVFVDDLSEKEFDLILIIEVLDSDRAGVLGKYPEKIIINTEDPSYQGYIDAVIVHEHDLFEASEEDGVITVPIRITKISDIIRANITLIIDDINITTKYIEFTRLESINKNYISSLEIVDAPIEQFENGIEIDETFDIYAHAYDIDGNTVDYNDLEFKLELFFNPITQAPARKTVVVLESNAYSISRGKVRFRGNKITRATTGHYFLRVHAYKAGDSSKIILSTDTIRFFMSISFDAAIIAGVAEKNVNALFYSPKSLNFVPPDKLEEQVHEIRMDQTYVFKILAADFTSGPLKNYYVNHPKLKFEEYPPIMHGLDNGPFNYVTIHYLSRYTDEEGFFYIEATVEYGGIGFYVVSFDFGTGISTPISFKTNNPITGIKIQAEPVISNVPPDDRDIDGYYTGRKFNIYARVLIDVSIGPKSGYLVIAHPQSVDGNHATAEILPHTIHELDHQKDNFIAWLSLLKEQRIAVTDRYGEAKFNHLSIFDVSGEHATVKFVFGAGDRREGMYTVTEPTNRNYTFIQSNSFEVARQPGRHTAAYVPIDPSPKIRMTSQILNSLNIVSAQLNNLFSKDINDTFELLVTDRYMSGTICYGVFSPNSITYVSDTCKMEPLKSFSKGPPYEVEITFDQLRWDTYGVNSMISLSFSSLMGHQSDFAAISQRMYVENLASNIILLHDPPAEISILQVFVLEVLVTVDGGFPLANARVTCNVTKDLDLSQISTEIFTSFANTEYNVQRSSLLAPGSRLDEKRSSAITNNQGIARLFLRVQESPIDSSVRLVCQSGRAVTSPSSKINIKHPISRITQSEEFRETVRLQFNRDPDGFTSTHVKLSSTFTLNLHQDENTEENIIRAQDIVILVVKFSEIEQLRATKSEIKDVMGHFNNFTQESSVAQEFIDLGLTLMRGVETVGALKNQVSERNRAIFNRPNIQGSQVTISNVTLILNEPGRYGLIFGANGVFTDIQTEEAQIETIHEVHVVRRYFNLYQTAFLTVFYFLVLALSSKLFKGYWLFLALVIVGGYLYLMSTREDVEMVYMIVVYVLAGLIALYMLWAFLIYFIDTFIRRKNPGYFFDKKKQYFMEYVYQRLNNHPSNHWVNRRKNLKLNLDGLYNTKMKNEDEIESLKSSIKTLPNSTNDNMVRISNQDLTGSFEIKRDLSGSSIVAEKVNEYQSIMVIQDKLTKQELMDLEVDVIPFEDLGLCGKFIRIFTPFELMYRRIWVNDCFVYPQVLLTCVLICAVSMGYLGYVMFTVIFGITESIKGVYSNVYDSVFGFLRNGVERYFDTLKVQATTTGLYDYFDHLETTEHTLNNLIFAIKLGVIVGTTVAIITVFANLFLILFDYKKRVLDARKGNFKFRKDKIPISMHSGLAGAIISNSIFMFFVIIITLTIVFSFLAWPLFWIILWRLKWNILSIAIGSIVTLLIKLIFNRICYNFDHVKRRGLLSLFDFFLLQVAILAGVVLAISRLGILFIALFISVMRIDVMAIPEWFANILYIDSFNKSYYASVLVQHYQNNPIMITFYELMFLVTRPVESNDSLDWEDRKRMNRRKIIRNRFHLWVFMSKNPSLKKYRVAKFENDDDSDEEFGKNGYEAPDLEQQNYLQKLEYQEKISGDDSLQKQTIEETKDDPRVIEVNDEDLTHEEVAEVRTGTPKFNGKINSSNIDSMISEKLEEEKE